MKFNVKVPESRKVGIASDLITSFSRLVGVKDKVFRKEVVFLIDISGSMQATPLESIKESLFAALMNLNQEDSFNLIAFSGETFLFSSALQLATTKTIKRATQWMQTNFVAAGGTNILQPLSQAMEMLSNIFVSDSISQIFLITDGSVENEKHICELVRNQVTTRGSRFPRISTFGIGDTGQFLEATTATMIATSAE